MRSAVYCSLGERLYAYMKAKNAASATPSISHHHPTNMSDMPNTSAVKAGRSAPQIANCSLKTGTTYTIRMPQTMHATAMIALGENIARLILPLEGTMVSLYSAIVASTVYDRTVDTPAPHRSRN